MTYNCYNYDYIPGSPTMLKQGVKYGSTPKNAFRGGNGSFLVREPAKLILRLKNSAGVTLSRDIASVARGVAFDLGTKLFAETAKKIGNHFKGKDLNVTDDNMIDNLDNEIRIAIRNK